MKTLLIGQAPGPNTDPSTPLHPYPGSATGAKLAAIMGLTPERYLEVFDRINLLNEFPGRHNHCDKFPVVSARIAASAIIPLLVNRRVVFVGRNVSNSFGYKGALPFHEWHFNPRVPFHFAVVPHASGRNHWYNKDGNKEVAQKFWRLFFDDMNHHIRSAA